MVDTQMWRRKMINMNRYNAAPFRESSVLGLFLLSLGMLLLPISAGAQCGTGWNASGSMAIRQRGQQFEIQLTLEQNGKVITGRANHTVERGDGGVKQLYGTVEGTIDGDNFRIQIAWSNGQTGVYTSNIPPSGKLEGEGWEVNSPNVRVPWHNGSVPLKCAPPPPPKPIRATGRAKAAPTTPAPPPPTPPFIMAGQPNLPPYMPYGIVGIGWDGGPDHKNVKIFVSINHGAEVPAFSLDHPQQSPVWKHEKVSMSVQLLRYHHYKFVLKAKGKTLSTVAFVVP